MSDFFLPRLRALAPYVPGEQPQDRSYIKLNTNESPYPPSPKVLRALSRRAVKRLNLYPDPGCGELTRALADTYGLQPDNIFVGNGSDEVLGFAFMAFADGAATFPAVSYGFYKVYAQLFGVEARPVPLNEDFTLPAERFEGVGTMVAIANPNAPTSLACPLDTLERVIASNPDHVVLIDEAYVDFGGESCLPLLGKYPNLLIVRTYSKSRALAGGRLGYAIGSPALIDDLYRVKNSFHPYSINRLTLAAGVAALRDRPYFERTVAAIRRTRDESAEAFRALGFDVKPSQTNFLFAAHPRMTGEQYYLALKRRGVLVRYLSGETLAQRVRITVGTPRQMQRLLALTREILEELS